MAGLLYRLGRFAARRHWIVIGTWVVLLALAGGGFALFGGTISQSITIPGTPTAQVQDELAAKFPKAAGGSGSIVFETKDGASFTAAEQTAVTSFLTDIAKMDEVKATTDPFTTQSQLDGQRAQITSGKADIATASAQLADGQTQLTAAQTQLTTAQTQLTAAIAQAAGAPAATQQRLAAEQAQLTTSQAQLTAQQSTLDANSAKLTEQSTTLKSGEKLLDLASDLRFVSKDGSAAVGTVQFTKSTFAVSPEVKDAIVAKAKTGLTGVHVYVTNDIAQGVPSVVGPGEVIGLFAALAVLVIMLGTIIGALLPLLSAITGLGVSLLTALSFSGLIQFNSTTTTLGIMLGLAVGIDYSLFILNRHRRQLKQGVEMHESIGLATGTSGNAVVFAGATVIVALLALNITGVPFLGQMGNVAALSVLVAILVAITFTPAMLSLVGPRILRKKERGALVTESGAVTGAGSSRHGAHAARAPRIPQKPMRTWRAIVTLVIGIAVLGVVALPALQMRLGLPDGSSEAIGSSQYNAFKSIEANFGAGQNSPLVVVADLPAKVSGASLTATEVTIGEKIAGQHNVSAVAPIGASQDGRVIAFQVIPGTGPSSAATETLVHDLRNMPAISTADGKITLGVAGNASANIDVSDKLSSALPLYLLIVVGLSLLILILVFRSFLVPITATLGFVLSLLATFGGITAIYQLGWLSAVFGVHDPAPILSFLPIIEVGVLFGLAMDYQLFLVSGMREAFAHGAPAKLAVVRGLHAGRPVVTAAAIIMISVFAGFVFSDSATIRPIGFGLAFGVLVDAFVVRQLLIPAAMHLLGRAAWWLPKWLDRILPDVDVEGAQLERTHPIGDGHQPVERGPEQDPEPDSKPDSKLDEERQPAVLA